MVCKALDILNDQYRASSAKEKILFYYVKVRNWVGGWGREGVGGGVGGDLTLDVGWITAKLNAEEWLIYFFLSLYVLSMEDNLEFITYFYWMVLRQTSLEIAFCCAIKLGPNKTPLLLSLTFKKDEVRSALGLSPNQRKSSPRLGDSFTLFGNIFWWKNFKYYALSQSSPVDNSGLQGLIWWAWARLITVQMQSDALMSRLSVIDRLTRPTAHSWSVCRVISGHLVGLSGRRLDV